MLNMRMLIVVCLSVMVVSQAAFAKKNKQKVEIYVVKQGDTPWQVSKRFDVSIAELLRFNNLSKRDGFRVGDKLKIPRKGEVTGSTYKVKSGDSVAKIADFHGISQNDLMAANGMRKSSSLRIGQELTIPQRLRGGSYKSHVVRKGDTLAGIAKQHGITSKRLKWANKMKNAKGLTVGRTLVIPEKETVGSLKPKKPKKLVKSGVKITGGVRHTVQPGQTLWIIARAYNIKKERIAKRNGFPVSKALKEGDRIIIPGAKNVVPVRVKGFRTQSIHFVRVRDGESATLRLITNSGKIIHKNRKKLSYLSVKKTKRKRRIPLFSPRLIHMIQRVAERWPGHTLELVSGYRAGSKGSESKHKSGQALDFRVAGVSNRELYEFCIQMPKSGCGYYPNSVFVHMDDRRRSAVWTDLSGPGESARYLRHEKKNGKQATAESKSEGGDKTTSLNIPVQKSEPSHGLSAREAS